MKLDGVVLAIVRLEHKLNNGNRNLKAQMDKRLSRPSLDVLIRLKRKLSQLHVQLTTITREVTATTGTDADIRGGDPQLTDISSQFDELDRRMSGVEQHPTSQKRRLETDVVAHAEHRAARSANTADSELAGADKDERAVTFSAVSSPSVVPTSDIV